MMGYRFRGTVFIETISASTAQTREKQQQKQRRVSAVRSPDGIFMMIVTAVLLFRSFSAKFLFNFRLALISNNQRRNSTKKITAATATATPEGK